MPVKLYSGLPGSGKTARMVADILDFKEKHPNRPVFAINVNGLDPSVAQPLTLAELQRWWELPPESLICIDECQEDDYFPLDRGLPPEWVKRVSKVRHEGMDFWMTTQHPTLMSPYIRRLVDAHTHYVRKFKSHVVQSFSWGRCMDACEKGASQKVAITAVGALPARVFELYKSSNAHNMKRAVPLKAWLMPVLVVIGIACFIAVPFVIKRARDRNLAAVNGGVAASGAPSRADDALRVKDYGKWLAPRVPGVPWTAPAFDGQTVKAAPRIFCIAWEDGKTNCITEQGTKYAVDPKVARIIARDGVYNPFLADRDTQAKSDEQRRTPVQPQAPPAASVSRDLSSHTVPGDRLSRKLSADYVPPEELTPNS